MTASRVACEGALHFAGNWWTVFPPFAGLTSVVVPTTTTTTTTTTLPCTTARCTLDAALHGPACGDESVPRSITKKLDRATSLLDRADGASKAKPAKRLRRQAKHVLAGAGKAAKGKKPKLTAECAAAIQAAVAAIVATL